MSIDLWGMSGQYWSMIVMGNNGLLMITWLSFAFEFPSLSCKKSHDKIKLYIDRNVSDLDHYKIYAN